MQTESNVSGTCRKCGKILKSRDDYCAHCQVELAEEHIADSDKETEPSRPADERKKKILQAAILLVLLGIIIFRIPAIISAFEHKQPVRTGTYETDAGADLCISTLWQISRMLEEGRLPDSSIVCPISGKPYLVIEDATDITVFCPDPGQHGLQELRVSRVFPCPEVKQ